MRYKKTRDKRNKGQSKLKTMRKHFKKRFLQRCNVFLTQNDVTTIIQTIQANKATFVCRQSNRITVFDVPLKEEVYRIVYDTERHTPVTVLLDKEDYEKSIEKINL